MIIYMDVCCLCRPFDNFDSPDGKNIEAEAVALQTIFRIAKVRNWTIVLSDVTETELANLADQTKAQKATTFIHQWKSTLH